MAVCAHRLVALTTRLAPRAATRNGWRLIVMGFSLAVGLRRTHADWRSEEIRHPVDPVRGLCDSFENLTSDYERQAEAALDVPLLFSRSEYAISSTVAGRS